MNNQPSKTSETAPTLDAPPASFVRIEIEYNMQNAGMVIRSRLPTLLLNAVLGKAQQVQPEQIPETGETAPRRIIIEYDMAKPSILPDVQTDASELICEGMFIMAFSMITQNQVMQRIQAMAAKSRIVAPDGSKLGGRTA